MLAVDEALHAMATLYTHAVVGAALAQLHSPRSRPWLYWCLGLALSVVPDVDAFSNVAYGSPLGHRGVTHSLLCALALGLFAAALAFPAVRGKFWALVLVYVAITASHAVLDAMTRGGEPVPFFWPMSNQRYGNWGPIPVSDVGTGLPNPWQSRALRSEMFWIWIPAALLGTSGFIYRAMRHTKRPPRSCYALVTIGVGVKRPVPGPGWSLGHPVNSSTGQQFNRSTARGTAPRDPAAGSAH